MKSKHFKRILSLVLSLFLVLGALPMSAFAAGEDSSVEQESSEWEGFDEFSSEVSKLLGETMEDNYISAVTLEVGSAEMMVDGEEQSVVEGRNVTPVTKDDVIMLPVRALADCEDAAVDYDSGTKTATVQTEDSEIAFTRGKAAAAVNEGETEEETFTPLSAEPELIDGTMYVPLDAMADFLGYDTEVIEEKVLLTKPYQTKRLIVKSAEDELETHGAVKEISGFRDLHILQYETEEAARKAQEKLMLTDGVEYVEPDTVVSTAEVHKSWGTDYIGADTYNAYLQESTGLEEVVVAVVDTGVDSEHVFLKDRIIPVNKNFVDSEPSSNDGHGHGTHVAGIVVDATLSSVKILPVKVLGSGGSGTSLSVYNGGMFAIEQNCDVINMSLGGYGKSELDRELVLSAVSHNIPVVVAAGNESADAMAFTPANVKEAITVGAIDRSGVYENYSNYGAAVDIWAPGSNINSSIPGDQFEQKSGTSMAAPHVVAAAAMLKTYNKALSPRQIEAALQAYAMESFIKEPGNTGTSKTLNVRKLKEFQKSEFPVVEKPVADVEPGTYYQEELSVTLSCATPGATIRYTTDGSIPTASSGEVYTGTLSLRESTRLIAKAFKEGALESYAFDSLYCVSSYPESLHYQEYSYYDTWEYTYPDASAKYLKITFDENTYFPFPEADTRIPGCYAYNTACASKYGMQIFDGDERAIPNEYGDIERNDFILDELQGKSVIVKGNHFTLFLKFPLTKEDYGFRVKSVEPLYEERLSAPQFVTPCENEYQPRVEYATMMWIGTSNIHYAENKSVTLSSPEGGNIYYTLDGSRPTKNSLKYTGPITLDEPKKIRAKAFKDGYVESETVSETYYSSKYPESLHYAKRDYYFNYVWKEYRAPDTVKYMAVTFDEKTNLSYWRGGSMYSPDLEFIDQAATTGPGHIRRTRFHCQDLAGQTVLVKGNRFRILWSGRQPETVEPAYGFKIINIEHFYTDDLIPIEDIKISGPNSVRVGQQIQLTASVSPANANTGILWRNGGNFTILEDNGVVTGLSEGEERIIASSRLVNSINPLESSFNGPYKDVTVSNIPAPTGKISYSIGSLTNQDVVATITPAGSARVINNGGSNTYTFTKNGEFTFELEGESGKTGSVTAKVDWIDKEIPTATLTYTPETTTNGEVLVTMHPSEDVTVTNTENHSRSIRVTENGPVRFEFADKAGNAGFVEEEITWIDKSDISAEFVYEDLAGGKVKASLVTSKPVTVTNNGGSAKHTFTENGSFVFEYEYDGGKTGTATANVCWLYQPVITYDITEPVNRPVTAMIQLPSDVSITNNGGSNTYVFEENGSFTFEFAGFENHAGSATAEVTWIDHNLTLDIGSAEELAAFAQRVNGGDDFAGVTVRLVRDIDMEGLSWTPVGAYGGKAKFSGTFDGQNFIISHFTTPTSVSPLFYGLFGSTTEDTVIKNVQLESCSILGNGLCGGIVGRNNGVIENCSVSGEVQGASTVGGIAGRNTGVIRACHMTGTVAGKNNFVGGIVGHSFSGQVRNCSANVTVIGSSMNVGGIAGGNNSGAVIENCCAAGKVQGSEAINGIGGIAGNLNGVVRNSYSLCTVENSAGEGEYYGGIAGRLAGESIAEKCVALNPSVAGLNSSELIGRIAGACDEDSNEIPVLAGNYAWSGMLLGTIENKTPVEDDAISPLTHMNGKGVEKEEIHTKAFWEAVGFTFGNGAWTWTEDKMPSLETGEPFDWPEWLLLDKEPDSIVTVTPPVAKAGLVYTGKPQRLIEPGTAEGGTLLYSLNENSGYSEEIPTGTNAGTYTVWYKVMGDEDHTDLASASIEASIKKAAQPENIPEDISVPDGTRLSEVTLPEGWSWKTPGQVLVTGENQVTVVYADTGNYEQTEFTITVTMAEPVHTHSPVKTAAKAATCTAEGNLEYWTCSGCGSVFEDENCTIVTTVAARTIPALNHDYEAAVTDPTCTEKGYTTHTCSRCHDSYTDSETPALGHSWGTWAETKSADCVTKGEEQKECSRCHVTETRELPLAEHIPGGWETVIQATTEQEGLQVKKCTKCGEELERETTPKLTSTRPDLPDSPLPPSPSADNPEPPVIDSEPAEWQNPFVDVKQGDWFYGSVEYVCENCLFYGTSETTFSPTVNMSRGMQAAVLYRLAKEPETSVGDLFDDVVDGKYYAEAVAWAAENNIVAGYGNHRFGPDDLITREQLATILWRYAGSPESTGKLDGFTDGNKATDYAVPALRWAVEQKIISGKGNGSLDPRGKATRAEVAAMLMRYCEKAE